MYRSRLITTKLRQLVAHFPCVVISGARQVGKSTMLRHLFPDIKDFVVFDSVTDVENARKDPELFLNNHATPLVLDEIQYAPELIAGIKRRIDQAKTPGMYILTGSQQWQVMQGISESLAGRAVFLDLDGFCVKELGNHADPDTWLHQWLTDPDAMIGTPRPRIDLDRSVFELLWRGFFPDATTLPMELVGEFYNAYQRTYLERDVRLAGDVSDWHQFGRFLRLAAAMTGNEINFSQFGRDIGVTPQTSQRWLTLLQSTFKWTEISAFSMNQTKRVSQKPKGYLSDTGLACFLQSISSPAALTSHPHWGGIYETAVINDIRKLAGALPFKVAMYHWRSTGGAEVDLILEVNSTLYPIEIKSTATPSRQDTTGISAFRNTYPDLKIERGLVIAPCDRLLQISNSDYAMPWDSE